RHPGGGLLLPPARPLPGSPAPPGTLLRKPLPRAPGGALDGGARSAARSPLGRRDGRRARLCAARAVREVARVAVHARGQRVAPARLPRSARPRAGGRPPLDGAPRRDARPELARRPPAGDDVPRLRLGEPAPRAARHDSAAALDPPWP